MSSFVKPLIRTDNSLLQPPASDRANRIGLRERKPQAIRQPVGVVRLRLAELCADTLEVDHARGIADRECPAIWRPSEASARVRRRDWCARRRSANIVCKVPQSDAAGGVGSREESTAPRRPARVENAVGRPLDAVQQRRCAAAARRSVRRAIPKPNGAAAVRRGREQKAATLQQLPRCARMELQRVHRPAVRSHRVRRCRPTARATRTRGGGGGGGTDVGRRRGRGHCRSKDIGCCSAAHLPRDAAARRAVPNNLIDRTVVAADRAAASVVRWESERARAQRHIRDR
eukprot:2161415-Prymnesium_polylepis.2